MEEPDSRNVIRCHFSELSNQLAVSSDLLLSVSVGFFQYKIIDRVTKAEINNKGGLVGADILLTHIDMKVEQSPNDYLVPVMNVLRDEVALRDTVRKMEDYIAGRPSSDSSGTQQSTNEAAMDDPESATVIFVPATSVADTVSAAERLRECFDLLLFSVIMIASRGRINLACLKIKISLHLQYARENTPDVQDHLIKLEERPSPEAVVTFLINNNFLGYLNFELLKAIKPVLCQADRTAFDVKLNEYQSKHNSFIRNNFQFIVKAFQQSPEISPASVIGLPKMTVELTTPWESKSLYQWKEIVSNIVEWGEYIIIKDIDINCVLITYQIMPFILPRIIQDLTDDVIIDRFRAVGATFTIPPDVMEMGVADREWITTLLKKPHPLEEPSNDAHQITESSAESLEKTMNPGASLFIPRGSNPLYTNTMPRSPYPGSYQPQPSPFMNPGALQFIPHNIAMRPAARPNYKPYPGSYEERKFNPPPVSDTELHVSPDNYRRKFKALLYYEEEEHVTLLAKNCDGYYHISVLERNEDKKSSECYLGIHGMSPSQILYASQASSEVRIYNSSGIVKGRIQRNYDYDDDVLTITMTHFNAQRLLGSGFAQPLLVKFEVKHSYFNSLHRCLDQITKVVLRRIIPSADDFQEGLNKQSSTQHDIPVNELDVFQSNALQTMAFSKSTAPVLIPGPFGSGKTRLLAVAAKYFSTISKQEKCRILLCCCQQDSADIFMRDYFLKMIKDGWNNTEVIRITSDIHRRGETNGHVIQMDGFKDKIDHYRSANRLLIVTTFMTAMKLPDCLPTGFFTHILIDEGAQAREPECVAPLSMATEATRIIIAGDAKQVGPKVVVLGRIPQENGLGVSLLERLHKSYLEIELANHYTVVLRNNYRCLPEILDLSSNLFYDSTLTACAKVPRIKDYPLHFICSSESNHPSVLDSCEDPAEVNLIIDEVVNLIQQEYIDATICIMSPSQRQVSLIRDQLYRRKVRGIKVLSSYQMQGQEFDVLFLSTVESIRIDGKPFDPLKSLCQPAIFNTAITRARSLIVTVGNPCILLKTDEAMGSCCWKKYIERCKTNGTYRVAGSVSKSVVMGSDTCKTAISKGSFSSKVLPVDPVQPVTNLMSQRISLPEKVTKPTDDIKAKAVDNTKRPVASHQPQRRGQDGPKAPDIYGQSFPSLAESMTMPKKEPKKKNIKTTPFAVTVPVKEEYDSDVLKSTLTRENYASKFHSLLSVEEKEHETILQDKCDGPYMFHILTRGDGAKLRAGREYARVGFITAKDLDGDKIAYAKQASEGIVMLFPAPGKRKKLKLELSIIDSDFTKGLEKIYVGLQFGDVLLLENFVPETSALNCNAQFILKHSYFERLSKGIKNLTTEVINTKLMPDVSNFSDETHKSSDTQVDSYLKEFISLEKGENMPHNAQMFALHRILNSDSSKAPLLVIGSFGAGKTRLLARAAYQILRNDRQAKVLVCAHHQRSVDSMIENYFGKMIEAGWRFEDKLVRLIPEGHYNSRPEYTKYYLTVKQLKDKFHRKPLKHLRLVLSTFSSAFSLYFFLRSDHFTHILLDEGAQSREPESIIPFCLANERTQIIIAGDHMQVGPATLVLGEEAIENGLSVSLLERLHTLYGSDELLTVSESHCVTLLTNFRSHHALLCLPSYLFYGSALVTVAEATTQLHPKAHYPLQFVCSSLDEEVVEVTDSYNRAEVVKVLNEVKKYVNDWPEEWGNKNLKDICVMVATANQKSILLRELREGGNYRNIKNIEVLTVYDIQGQEFQAVFLSTAEPTYPDGMSKNPTKSPCSQYVFNTALTRAKSLFVCVGNPFLLLKIEEKMNNDQNFWRDYMKRCIIAKTFHVHETGKSIAEVYKSLQTKIFYKYNVSNQVEESLVNNYDDPIIKRLQEFVKQRRQFRKCKLQIYAQQSNQVWEIAPLKEARNPNRGKWNFIEEIKSCELLIKTHRDALAVPLDPKEEPIAIKGMKNRRGAFHGDIVTIGVIRTHETSGQKYGKVIKLEEGRHTTKYVCTADRDNIISFYPIDKLEPAIVNLPKISRFTLQYKPEEFGQSQKSYVTVFEESSLNTHEEKDVLPIVKELIPLEMCSSLLFVVKVLSWSPEYRKPLGAVIEALPQTNSFFIMEKLLTVAHNIHYDDSANHLVFESTDDVQLTATSDLPMYEDAFTIDPPGAINLDDALSVSYDQSESRTLKVNVLITDVAKRVEQNGRLDKFARQRGTSVYGLDHASHMLPESITQSRLSLLPGQCRDVLVISAIVTHENTEIVRIDDSIEPKRAQMRSVAKLTYEDAQKMISGEIVADSPHNDMLIQALKWLFKVAMKIRIDRIGDAAYCCEQDVPGEERNWQSHLLVSELMIWANRKVADFLHNGVPALAIFRRQLPPVKEELEKVETTYKDAFMYSLSLQHHLETDSVEQCTEELLIPLSVCNSLRDAIEKQDLVTLRNILSDNSKYPQLAAVDIAMRSINRRAEYVKGVIENMEDDRARMVCSHHSLNVPYYTHFTSPMRRYLDIVVQRLINALITKSEIFYKEDELRQLCTYLNRKIKSASKFESDLKKLDLASNCERSLDKLEVYLMRSLHKQHKFEICIPSVKYNVALAENSRFDQSQLNCLQRHGSDVTWKIIAVPFKSSPDFLCNPKIAQFNKCFVQDSTTAPSTIHATVFINSTEEEATVSMEKISYIANILDESLRMNLDKWSCCNEFVKTYSTDPSPLHLKLLTQLQSLLPEHEPNTAIIPEAFCQTPVIRYNATRSLQNGEVLNVWMGKSMRNPVSSPDIHLIEVAPSVRVCLQHNKSPAMCFSDTQLRLTSKSSYLSENEYMSLWCKALLAEASHDAVKTKTLVLLKDVDLIWPVLIRPDNCLDNIHFRPESALSFTIQKRQLEFLDFVYKVKIRPGDLVCARYSVIYKNSQLFAVYHFVVEKVKEIKKTGDKTVRMKPVGEHGCRVSMEWQEILKHNPPCELQIIKMSDSFNRLYQRLIGMDRSRSENNHNRGSNEFWPHDPPWSEVAINVALGRPFPQVRHESYLEVFKKNSKCFKLWNDETKELNRHQKMAIENALHYKFSLIQGPPGTGKSIVGAHLAYTFAMGNRKGVNYGCVMYCGPSNKAVDVVHDYFQVLNKKSTDTLKILRLYGRTHEHLYNDNYRSEIDDEAEISEGKCKERFQRDALHWKVRQMQDQKVEKEELEIKDYLQNNIIPIEKMTNLKKLITDFEKEVLRSNYDIILCTCNETCSRRVLSHLKVAQCIVDECGMATEPETLAAISLAEHAVLIGDHKQLQPVVKYQPARQCGLTKSLFERYAENDQRCAILTQLRVQYRMHNRICEVPSEMYYDGKLEPDESVYQRRELSENLSSFWPQGQGSAFPLMFCDIVGEEEDYRTSAVFKGSVDSHSKSNLEEANKTVEIIKRLVEKHNLHDKDIAVLTPYAAQKKLVTDLLVKSNDKRIQKVVVSSIVESQGDEYNIVILNTVRSLPLSDIADHEFVQPDLRWRRENLGFLTDPHQINVAITRAKHGLIIIGNRVLLNYIEDWRTIIRKLSP